MAVITDPVSSKVILVEIDYGNAELVLFWYAPGVWAGRYFFNQPGVDLSFGMGAFGYGNFGGNDSFDITEGQSGIINSVNVAGILQTKESSLANCLSTQETFFNDSGNQIIYIHFLNNNPPESFAFIVAGFTVGFRKGGTVGYYNDIYYEPIVKSVPAITLKRDSLNFGRISFGGGSVLFDNLTGFFDQVARSDVFGQQVRILFGLDDWDYIEFIKVFVGTVDDYSLTTEEATVNIIDNRKKLSYPVPPNVFDSSTYPEIKDLNLNKPIPVCYGSLRNVPTICVNETNTMASSYTFKVCDTANHSNGVVSIINVRVDGSVVTPISTSLTGGSFVLATADYDPGQTVICDVVGLKNSSGVLIDNGLDVIRDLLETFGSLAWNNTNIDLGEWATATAQSKTVGIRIDKVLEIIKIIEDLCASLRGSFIPTNDGRYTFRFKNETKDAILNIPKTDLLANIGVDYPKGDFITSITLGYDRDWSSGDFLTYPNKTRESAIFERYDIYQPKELETYLSESSEVQELSEEFLDDGEEIKAIFEAVIKTQGIHAMIEDLVELQADRPQKTWYGWVLCHVIGVIRNFETNQITLTLRYIRDLTQAELDALVLSAGTAYDAFVDEIDAGDSDAEYVDEYDGGDAFSA